MTIIELMTFIDTHAHIYVEQFDADRSEVIGRAAEEGVSKIYMPNIDSTSIDNMMEVEEKNSSLCIALMGLHPCSVKKDFEKELYLVEEWLSKRHFVAVGEIGTDLYWDKTYWEQQKEAFKIQVEWAKQYQIPIVIHCRESIDETIEMVESLKDDTLKGVFHCFGGTKDQAQKIIELGFYIGLGGVTTFKNGGLDKIIPEIDLKHIVLETDSPYLAPSPHRGKRNEPAYVSLVANRIAEIQNRTLADVAKLTTSNALNLYQQKVILD